MGYIEIVVNRAKQIPGPNAYGFADYPKKMKEVKFSDANVPSMGAQANSSPSTKTIQRQKIVFKFNILRSIF